MRPLFEIYALLTINYIHWKQQPQEKLNGPTKGVLPARGEGRPGRVNRIDRAQSSVVRLSDHYGPGLGRTMALGFEEIGEQKGKIDRLLRIEPRIAERMVAIIELGLCDRARTPGAFRNVLAGHFEMHAAC